MRTKRMATLRDNGKGTLAGPMQIVLAIGDSYMVGIPSRNYASQKNNVPGVGQYHIGGFDPINGLLDANVIPLIQQVQPPVGYYTYSMAEGFADTMHQLTGKPYIIVPCACNGTRLSGVGNVWGVGSSLHTAAITQANAAIAAAQVNYPGSQLAAIVQWLGANDMTAGATRSDFSSALTSAIADYRSSITGASSVPFVMGGILPDYIAASPTVFSPVEEALQDVHAAGTGIIYYPMAAGYNSGDNLHATPLGSAFMGQQLAAASVDTSAPVINIPSTITAYEATNFQVLLYWNNLSFGGADRYATWTLSGTDASQFEIAYIIPGYTAGDLRDSNYQVVLRYLSDAVLPAYATQNSFSLTLTAKGSNGVTATRAITLNTLQAYGSVSSGANPVTATYMSYQGTAVGADLTKLPTQAFGAGLNLIYIHASGNNPNQMTSVTVNGVHATFVAGVTSGNASQVWSVPIAAAGNYSPVIVPNGTFALGDIEVVCLNYTVAAAASTSNVYGTSMTCPASGIVVGMGPNGGAITGGSGTTLLSGPLGSTGYNVWSADRSTTGAITVNFTSFVGCISMAFAKA